MANHRRPDLRIVQAKKAEIRRRYQHQQKVTRRGRSMAAIRVAELTRWLEDTHKAELEQDERSETIARIFVHHLICLANGDRRAAQWLATFTPWLSLRSREILISEASHCPIKYKARTLGWKLRLTDDQRTRLKITTIAAIDVSDEQRAARRKANRAAAMRRLRASHKAQRDHHID